MVMKLQADREMGSFWKGAVAKFFLAEVTAEDRMRCASWMI